MIIAQFKNIKIFLYLFLFLFYSHVFSSFQEEENYPLPILSFHDFRAAGKNPRHFFEETFFNAMGAAPDCLRDNRAHKMFDVFFDSAKTLFNQKKLSPNGDCETEENLLSRTILGYFSPDDSFLHIVSFLTALGLRDVPDGMAHRLAEMDGEKIPLDRTGQGVIVLFNPHAFFYDMQINPAGDKENKNKPTRPAAVKQLTPIQHVRNRGKQSIGSCDFDELMGTESDGGNVFLGD